jgi:predicted transcriptional regulator
MAKRRDGIMTFRLPDEEKAQLFTLAEGMDRSMSDLAVMAIRDLITKLGDQGSAPKGKGKK